MPETPKKQRARGNEANFGKLLSSLQNGSAVQQEMIAARVRAGLTQAQLAQRMGTTQSAIARLETGKFAPSLETLEKLALATGSRLVLRLDQISS
jgi:predicted transcriptional regulator